jgi:hypothetical protein
MPKAGFEPTIPVFEHKALRAQDSAIILLLELVFWTSLIRSVLEMVPMGGMTKGDTHVT